MNSQPSHPKRPLRLRSWGLIGLLALAVWGLSIREAAQPQPATDATASAMVSSADPATSAPNLAAGPNAPVPTDITLASTTPAARSSLVETLLEVQRNDTLSKLFARAGLAASQLSFLLGSAQAA